MSKAERMNLLMPIYEQVRSRPALLERILPANASRSQKEAWMKEWPLSPLAYLEIDMHVRRFEVAVSRWVYELHQAWLSTHPEEGRRLFGDGAVDLATSGMATGSGGWSEESPQSPTVTTVGTNRNVGATDAPTPEDYQGEIQLAVNPNNPSQIVAAANTWDDQGGACGDFGMQAVFYSTNGGATWQNSCVPSEAAYGMVCSLSGTFGSDPAVIWDAANNAYVEYMMLCTNGATNQFSLVVAKSTDSGANWSALGIVKNSWATGTIEDKNFYDIDRFPTSPFNGRHYTCWDRDNNEKFARSTNGGATWTEVDLPTPGGFGNADLGCDIAVEDNGHVHVAFNRLACAASCTDERMFHTRSTDGGATFSAAVLVHDFNMYGFGNPAVNCPPAQDGRCISGFGSIAIDNSGGPCRGRIYVAYTDFPVAGSATGADVRVRYSTDDGATFPISNLVNDDAGTSGNTQYNGFMAVDRGTRQVVAAFQDTRNDAAGDQETNFYLARSTNCGTSFTANTKLSNASAEFNNSAISQSNYNSAEHPAINPNQSGEYLGLDVRGGRAYVSWTDTRHFFPGSTGETQKENLGFAAAAFDEIFQDGFETQDSRVWSDEQP